jgi:hypothetical protein
MLIEGSAACAGTGVGSGVNTPVIGVSEDARVTNVRARDARAFWVPSTSETTWRVRISNGTCDIDPVSNSTCFDEAAAIPSSNMTLGVGAVTSATITSAWSIAVVISAAQDVPVAI